MKKAHRSSNWMILKRLAQNKNKNDLVDASGDHFKVGDASRSGGQGQRPSRVKPSATLEYIGLCIFKKKNHSYIMFHPCMAA